jgi:acetyl-CoA carboxylase alpha subunit
MGANRLQLRAAVALLAIVPIVAFLLGRSTPVVALAVVNVFIIAWSIYTMLSPSDHKQAHA